MIRPIPLLGILFTVVCALPACAQASMAKISFRNQSVYTDAELLQVAGLKSRDRVTNPGLQVAAQRLMDTGCFEDVKVEAKGTGEFLQVIFVLTPDAPGQAIPVGFENFVWLTPAELTDAVHAAAPLFHGDVPEAGNELDAITAGLRAAVAAKGVSGVEISHERLLPTSVKPMQAYEFRVTTPSVRVGEVHLTGVLPEFAAAEDLVLRKLRGTPYTAGDAELTTADVILQPYLNAGYLNATLDGMSLTPGVLHGRAVDVDMTATVHAGQMYHVKHMAFAGAPLVSPETFARAATLHSGDVASRKLLLQTLSTLDRAYRQQGYMDEYVQTDAVNDPSANTVSYTFTMVPGDQYRIGDVAAVGLSSAARAEFDREWTMKPGDLYNPDYISSFLTAHGDSRELSPYTATFQGIGDPQTHLVALTLTFVPARR